MREDPLVVSPEQYRLLAAELCDQYPLPHEAVKPIFVKSEEPQGPNRKARRAAKSIARREAWRNR